MPASKGLYGAIAEMTDADLFGFELQKLTCRSCFLRLRSPIALCLCP